ncbi:MAG TPA: hypothetical protein VMJ65_13805 [Solirubrobacteraceae bacterium]|nr:hypothetical protein [Solirubrobacteraceae bacterium]
MALPWSSALAAALERDRQRLLVAFVELRAALHQTASSDFVGGEPERAAAFAETEHDYVALVEVGAEAARLQTALEGADREATTREIDTAELLVAQMDELAEAVRTRLPPGF